MKSIHSNNWELPLEETDTDACKSFSSSRELVKESFKIIERLYESHMGYGPSYRIPTDFPAIRKSAVPLNILRRAAIQNDMRVALFCSGMTKIETIFHFLATESRVPSHHLNTGALKEADWPNLINAAMDLSNAKIFIDDTKSMTISEMISRSKALTHLPQLKKRVLVITACYI